MIITAQQKFTRQTPRKVRLVANTVKQLPLEQAIRQLAVMDRKASIVVLKVLRQAMANAINNHSLAFQDLHLKSIIVDEGATYKRFRAVARGRAHTILKRSCHVKVELEKVDATAQSASAAEAKTTNQTAETAKATSTKASSKKTTATKQTKPAKKAATKTASKSTASSKQKTAKTKTTSNTKSSKK